MTNPKELIKRTLKELQAYVNESGDRFGGQIDLAVVDAVINLEHANYLIDLGETQKQEGSHSLLILTNTMTGRILSVITRDVFTSKQAIIKSLDLGLNNCERLQDDYQVFGSDCFDFTLLWRGDESTILDLNRRVLGSKPNYNRYSERMADIRLRLQSINARLEIARKLLATKVMGTEKLTNVPEDKAKEIDGLVSEVASLEIMYGKHSNAAIQYVLGDS